MSTRNNIVADGLIFSVDALNKLGGNTSSTTNLSNPLEEGSFENGVSVVDGSFNFDGVNDRINFDNSHKLSNISISCWLKVSNINQTGFIVSHSSGVDDGYSLVFNGTTLHAQFSDGTNASFVNSKITTSSYLSNNTWHNVTSTFNGTNHLIYVDGILSNTYVKASTIFYSSTNLRLGVREDLALHFNGNISSVKIYNKALTISEIKQNYEALKHRFGF